MLYILIITAFLMLVRISQVDFTGDNSHYAVRSLGYVDTMFSDQQTTPLNWFEHFPWWANLSFHDHPALLFFVQHIFLSIHESIFFAKLPYVLFSLGTLILVYQGAKENYGEDIAFWSTLFLAFNSLFLYTVRAGYMEAGVIFFIALTLFFFSRFLKQEKYWWYFGVSLGLCFLAKYSVFFLLPALFGYILIKHRGILKRKKIYLALLLFLAVASPIIIYNLMMYKTTGHFDYQFSRLFHTANPWVADEVGGAVMNLWGLFILLGKAVLFPYLILSLIGLICALSKKKMLLIAGCILFLTGMFVITGASYNHLNLYNLFLVLPLAYFFVTLKNWQKLPKMISKTFVYIFTAYIFITAVNSHILIRPFMETGAGWFVSGAVNKNVGIYQLDRYLDKLIADNNILSIRDGYQELKNKKPSLVDKYGTKPEALQLPARQFSDMIVYDDNLNWFVELWPFKRRRFYHNIPILSTEELKRFAPEAIFEKIYFIKATENTAIEGPIAWTDFPIEFEKTLIDKGIEPVDYIYRTDGLLAFKVYIFEFE